MAQYAKYISLDVSSDKSVFEFTSYGPKGEIKMVVQFLPTDNPIVFNLGFGNIQPDGSVDDRATNDNRDRDKILATISELIYDFTKRHPEKFVGFTGSTKERTRLYRMVLTINYDELSKSLDIFGITEDRELEEFQKGQTYVAFLLKRK